MLPLFKNLALLCALIFSFALSGETGTAGTSPHEQIYEKTYPNGDVYLLIGNLSEKMSFSEFRRFATISKWLGANGYRTIVNPAAEVADVQEAVTNPNTVAVIWSSHGTPEGNIIDAQNFLLPKNIFTEHAGPRMRYLVLSNCHSECTFQTYKFRPGTMVTTFGETTTSDDLLNHLLSAEFDESLLKATGEPKGKCRAGFSVLVQ